MAEKDAASGSVSLGFPSPRLVKPAEFAAMPMARRLVVLPYLDPLMRQNCILECTDAGALVQSMDLQDLYLTIKGIGLKDATGLVSLMSSDQYRGCLDLDCWSRDEIIHDNAWSWLTLFDRSDVELLHEKFMSLDFEFDISLLVNAVKVFIAKEDFDPDEGAPQGGFTPDGVHYLVFECPEEREELIKRLFTDMFHRDYEVYVRLLNAVRDSMPSQSQEEAYRWRDARLADLGFPEFSEAIKLYTRVEKKRERFNLKSVEFSGGTPPMFAIVRHDGSSVLPLSDVEKLGEKERASISSQAAFLINSMVIADRVDPGDIDTLVRIMEKARGYVSIGLSELGPDHLKTLCAVPIIDIFRTGYAKVLDLQDRAKKLVDEHPLLAGDKKALRLDALSRETIAALLSNRPALFRGVVEKSSDEVGPFTSMEDINAVSKVLDSVDASAEIFGSVLKIFKRDLAAMEIKNLNVSSKDEITECKLLNTCIANKVCGRSLAPVPIPIPELVPLTDALFLKKDEKVVFSPLLERTINDMVEGVKAAKPGLGPAAGQLLGSCLGELLDETAHLERDVPVKPDFIGSILLRTR